jgi:hypothetical protein
MLEIIQEYFYGKPSRIVAVGKALATIGCFFVLAGAVGGVFTAAVGSFSILQNKTISKTLSDVFPDAPLWWVPESWIGFVVPIMLTAYGLYLCSYGRHVERILKNF